MPKSIAESFHYFRIEEGVFPFKIIRERRRSVRVSLGSQSVILRLPRSISISAQEQYITWAQRWLSKQLKKKPSLINRFQARAYTHGSNFKIGQDNFEIKHIIEDRNTLSGKIEGPNLILKLPPQFAVRPNKQIANLVSRICANHYNETICKRVDFWNDSYFQESINQIKLKYNRSNWGSCSRRANINLSTRILFTPTEIQDYIIVHELAHLKEMNHSKKFWAIVASVYPKYQSAEKWLKEQGDYCHF